MKTVSTPEVIYYTYLSTSLGWVLVGSESGRIATLQFCNFDPRMNESTSSFLRSIRQNASFIYKPDDPLLQEVSSSVISYLESGQAMGEFPLKIDSATPFQQTVWRSLLDIPFGETRSYNQIAEIIGKPKSSRAVGQACARNPVALLIPCHRVVAANGKLGGFSGGLHIKAALLTIEGSVK